MSTRDQILNAVLKNQPPATALPNISMFTGDVAGVVQKYINVFNTIGGTACLVNSWDEIVSRISADYDTTKRVVTSLPALAAHYEMISPAVDPHTYEDVEVAVIKAHFGVAENGAVWLTEDLMVQRIIPYICQHLAIVITAESIVPTLHEAYEIIGAGSYGFGGFIAGPSKTADIEQALVLGAHGPLSMSVFVLQEQ